jgi:hypothetical protein
MVFVKTYAMTFFCFYFVFCGKEALEDLETD